MEDKFRLELLKDEQLQWSGQPETSVIFTGADIFLVPFSLLWGGSALFGGGSVLFCKGTPGFFALFVILFVFMGLYFIFGRFIWKNYKKKRTYYAVTNKRVIVLTEAIGRNLQAEFIDRIAVVNKSVRANGIGTIRFGSSNMMATMYGNTGMDFFGSFYCHDVPVFYDIKEAERVYAMIMELRSK